MRASSLVSAGMYATMANAMFGSSQNLGLVANGVAQATATPLVAGINVFGTVGTGGSVVLRNEGSARITVLNAGANVMSVFPPVNGTINAGTVNTAVSVPVGKLASFLTLDGMNWYADISA